MKVNYTIDGKEASVEAANIDVEELSLLNKTVASESDMNRFIENLNIAAEAKVILSKILHATMSVGSTVVKFGKKIFDMIMAFNDKFPNVSQNLVLTLAFGLLVASIPLIGSFIAPLVTTLLAILGIVKGYLEDSKNDEIKTAIKSEISKQFHVMQNAG